MKAMPIPNTTKETLQTTAHKNVRKGSAIFTDGSPSHNDVANRHYAVHHSAKEYVAGMHGKHIAYNGLTA